MSLKLSRGKGHKRRSWGIVVLVLLVVLAGCLFCAWRLAVCGQRSAVNEHPLIESHNRLLRSEIPAIAANTIRYRELFADNNDVQLKAAKKMGLKTPEAIKQPEECDDLVVVKTNPWYSVDTLYHSKPYLVPEASLLLTYISRRFDELQDLEGIETKVRPIVTSFLRNKSQVSRLRRVNRNATENSCHLYGTTFDLSYCRFVTTDGEVVMDNGKYKQLLALALYELRFEGLCYVKYERRPPCFHITVRAVDYEGGLACTTEEYVSSGQASRKSECRTSVSNVERQKIEETLEMSKPRLADSVEITDSRTAASAGIKPESAAKSTNQENTENSNDTKVKKNHPRTKEFEHRSNYVFD